MIQDDYLSRPMKSIPLSEHYASFLGTRVMNQNHELLMGLLKLRIKLGLLSINLENAKGPEQMIHEGDYFSSIVHFHERPVLDEEIEIIYEDEDILVVNKPASMVIYPGTGYRMNSLIFILAKEMGYMNIRPVHRLDKPTSGVMIFSKVILVIRILLSSYSTLKNSISNSGCTKHVFAKFNFIILEAHSYRTAARTVPIQSPKERVHSISRGKVSGN